MLALLYFAVAAAEPLLVHFDRVQDLKKRSPVGIDILNKEFSYVASISVGTPGQDVQVTIDTGSSDLWVPDALFDASKSATFNDSEIPFYTSYFDGTEAEGSWVHDAVSIGGTPLHNVQFGLASFANASSYLGIGMAGGEAPLIFPQQNGNLTAPYANVPLQFRDQGIIPTATYSLWLNDPTASSGSLLFGGIDTNRFVGDELTLLPMYNFYGTPIPQDFRVILSALSLDSQPVAELSYSVSLDSGSTAIALPLPVIEALGNAIDYSLDDESGFFFGDCSNSGYYKNLEFNFLGANISVPLKTLISYAYANPEGTVVATKDGKDQCMLGIQPAGGPADLILGDFVLRYMYVTFDLENYEVGIAQASASTAPSSIKEITSRIPGIPAPHYADNYTHKGIQTFEVKPNATSTPAEASTSLPKRCAA